MPISSRVPSPSAPGTHSTCLLLSALTSMLEVLSVGIQYTFVISSENIHGKTCCSLSRNEEREPPFITQSLVK